MPITYNPPMTQIRSIDREIGISGRRSTYVQGTTTVGDLTAYDAGTSTASTIEAAVNTELQKYLYQPMTSGTQTAITNDLSTMATANGWINNYDVTPNHDTHSYNINWGGYVNDDVGLQQADGVEVNTRYEVNTNGSMLWPEMFQPPLSKRDKLKQNLLIKVKTRADKLLNNLPENEQVAIETLREEISETDYRRYMKYGFITVEGKSGDRYQIFRNKSSHTKVWRGSKLIEEVCVHIKDSKVPPTDGVIAFKNMIQINEDEFKKLGNVYNMRKAA